MADPRAYPVSDEIKENQRILKEAMEQIKQAYIKEANVVYEPPRPVAPTQELNQSYIDEEEDPFRVDKLLGPDYNRSLQELIKKRLNVNVKILAVDIQTDYNTHFQFNQDEKSKWVFDAVPIIKLNAIYPWDGSEEIEIEMKFKRDLIFTKVLNDYFPQLNNLELSQEASIALRLALILGKIGKELQKLNDDFGEVANTLGISIESYTTHMRWNTWE